MNPCFLTGSNTADLQSDINLAISNGCSDLTIYGISGGILTNNFDDGISDIGSLTALRFSDVVFDNNAFEGANFSDLRLLDLGGVSVLSSKLFLDAKMNNLASIIFAENIDIKDAFRSIEMKLLQILDLRNVLSMESLVFTSNKLYSLTDLLFRSDAVLSNEAFSNAEFSDLKGICLNRGIQFQTDTFIYIITGPQDLQALGSGTVDHNSCVYASDFYGYACDPLFFTVPAGVPFNVFSDATYVDSSGSPVTDLVINYVNESSPGVFGNLTISADGTVVASAQGDDMFTMRYSANTNTLIGARSVRVLAISPCSYYPTEVANVYTLTTCGASGDMAMILKSDITGLLCGNTLLVTDLNDKLLPPYQTIGNNYIPIVERTSGLHPANWSDILLIWSDGSSYTYYPLNCDEEPSLSTAEYTLICCNNHIYLGIGGDMSSHITNIPGTSDDVICFVIHSDTICSGSDGVSRVICSSDAANYQNLNKLLILRDY